VVDRTAVCSVVDGIQIVGSSSSLDCSDTGQGPVGSSSDDWIWTSLSDGRLSLS
jgi:hypothetical protein